MKHWMGYILDSQNLSVGTGLLVIKAAELIKKVLSAKEIIEELENTEKNTYEFYFKYFGFLHAVAVVQRLHL